MEAHELVAVGDAALVSAAREGSVTRRFGLDNLAVLLELREDLRAVVDLEDAGYGGGGFGFGPTRFEDYLDDVVTRVGSGQVRNRVLEGLVGFQEVGFLEDLAARGAGEYVVAEREEEVGVGGDVRFGTRPGWFSVRVGLC